MFDRNNIFRLCFRKKIICSPLKRFPANFYQFFPIFPPMLHSSWRQWQSELNWTAVLLIAALTKMRKSRFKHEPTPKNEQEPNTNKKTKQNTKTKHLKPARHTNTPTPEFPITLNKMQKGETWYHIFSCETVKNNSLFQLVDFFKRHKTHRKLSSKKLKLVSNRTDFFLWQHGQSHPIHSQRHIYTAIQILCSMG